MRPKIDRWIAAADSGAEVLRGVPGIDEAAIEIACDRIEAAMAMHGHNIARGKTGDKIATAYAGIAASIGTAAGAAEEELAEGIAGPDDDFCSDRQTPEEHQRDFEAWQADLETTIRCLRRLEKFNRDRAAYWATPAMRPRSSDDPSKRAFVNALADIFCAARGISRSELRLSASEGPRAYAMNFLVAVLQASYDDYKPERRSIMRWVDRKGDNFA